jgi:hypothetical protein
LGPIAAGVAAFATGFISYMCLTLDSGPADAGLRADAGKLFVTGTVHPKPDNLATAAVGADMRGGSRMRLASLATELYSSFAFSLRQARPSGSVSPSTSPVCPTGSHSACKPWRRSTTVSSTMPRPPAPQLDPSRLRRLQPPRA